MEFIVAGCINLSKEAWKLLTNIRNLKSDVESLIENTEQLGAREDDVLKLVEREEVERGKKRRREVDVWLKSVESHKRRVCSVEEKVREERGLFLRYKLTKQIADRKTEAAKLLERGVFSDGVAIEPVLGSRSPLPTATLVGESANKTLKRILNYLVNVQEIRKVGVWGMGGVGKTTILKHIHNLLLNSGDFKNIIWVTVSKAPDLHRLQLQIANSVGLFLSNISGNEERTSLIIHAALSRREKCLLILDDVWEPFPLERIGIPEPNQTNGFKLAITTRSLKVCRVMETEREVKVNVLLDKEAWELFKEKVGGCVLDSPEIKPIAELLVEECGCLPLAIITVGRALREVGDVSVWRNALTELRRSYSEINGMKNDAFNCLMFSYNRLRNETMRNCFLYCVLYDEYYDDGIDAEELIDNWVGEGLIDEVGNIEQERDMGYAILSELIDACMVESVFTNSANKIVTIKLQDLIRDLAKAITRASPRFMVKAGKDLQESPSMEEWLEDTKRVSLIANEIKILSGQPMCPELTTLLLQGNELLTEISGSFFEKITGLRVLDLSESSIISLPESFCGLTSLRVLRLNSCRKLKNVPCLAKLKHLQVLGLDDTSIEELPLGMEELTSLRVLRLNSCRKLKNVPCLAKLKHLRELGLDDTSIEELPLGMEELINLKRLCLNGTDRLKLFPAEIISKLSRLEELQMINCGWRWRSNTASPTADIKEIVNLSRIACLLLCIEDVQSFNTLVGSGKLLSNTMKSFIISFRRHDVDRRSFDLGGMKRAVVGSYASTLMIPCNIDILEIQECHDVTRLSQFSDLPNEIQTNCIIEACDGMEFIVMMHEKTLPNLEYLQLFSLPNLRGLSDGVASIKAFVNLQLLNIQGCNKMKSLISLGLLQNLQNLRSIWIYFCKSMEDIVADDENSLTTNFSLPKLKDLLLQDLPELKIIFTTTISCPSLKSVIVYGCPKLKKLPFTSHNLSPTLRCIRGEKEWWDALEWDNPDIKIQLQDRFTRSL